MKNTNTNEQTAGDKIRAIIFSDNRLVTYRADSIFILSNRELLSLLKRVEIEASPLSYIRTDTLEEFVSKIEIMKDKMHEHKTISYTYR